MTPDDVYALLLARSDRTYRLIVGATAVVCSLLAIQIVAKVIIFARVLTQGKRIEAVLKRCELVLAAAEAHGEITDRNKARTEKTLEKLDTVINVEAGHLFHLAQQGEVIGKDVKEIKDVVVKESPSGTIELPKGTIPAARPQPPEGTP